MAIIYEIESLVPTSRRTQSAWLILENDSGSTAYRRVEVTGIPRGLTDEVAVREHIDERWSLAKLWSRGRQTDEARLEKAKERDLTDYYQGILRAVERTRRRHGTLDMALAAGLEWIGQNKRKQADFETYRSWAGLDDPQGAMEEAMLLLIMQNFALQGLVRDLGD